MTVVRLRCQDCGEVKAEDRVETFNRSEGIVQVCQDCQKGDGTPSLEDW